MTRRALYLLPGPTLVVIVYLLGEALDGGDWPAAVVLGAIVAAGIVMLSPGAPTPPNPARAIGVNARASGERA